MDQPRSDDAADVVTAAEPGAHHRAVSEPDSAAPSDGDGSEGLESQILLARARQRLLGPGHLPPQVGRYRVLERLGAGGMGVVYAAIDDALDRTVALKVLRSELAPGSSGRQRLLREAQATARLSHPNVVHVYEVGQQGDQVYMAMELVRGETLRAWQEQPGRAWREVIAMYCHAGEGLVAAHAEGIVHRDFKPDNVLVGRDARPQIVDFGLARASGELESSDEHATMSTPSGARWRELDITGTGTILGTPAYMAPEQLTRGKLDGRSDQFAFCVSLFEGLYGQRPFVGSTHTELADHRATGLPAAVLDRRGVPATIHAIVTRGLARDPDQRFASMRALLDALADATRTPAGVRRWALGAVALGGVAAAALALSPPLTPIAATAMEPAATSPVDPWAEIVAASDLPPLVPTPHPDDPAGVTVHRLRNGLSIYVAHRPLEPMVSVTLAIRAGPTEEGPDHPGLASLVLSAVHRGTDRLGVDDIDRERAQRTLEHTLLAALPTIDEPATRAAILGTVAASEAAGAAWTLPFEYGQAARALGAQDMPMVGGRGALLGAKLPSNRVGAWLRLAAELVQRPVFRGFLGACADELAMMASLDQSEPDGRARDPWLARATGVHRGGAATLEYLAGVPLGDARAFHHRWYRPNNAALVFVGDITPEVAIELAEQGLGTWEPAPLPPSPVRDEPLPARRTLLEVTAPHGPALVLTWPMPPLGTDAYAELEGLARVLGGRVGLLAELGRGQAPGWGVRVGEARDFGVIVMPSPDHGPAELERVALANLQAIADDRVDEALWASALQRSEIEQLAWARGPGSLGHTIVESYLDHAPWEPRRVAITPPPSRAEVVAATQRLLARDLIVTHTRTGEFAPIELPSLPTVASSPPTPQRGEFARAIVDSPAPVMEPRFLVAGSAYHETRHGAGRVITTTTDGPLYWLTWILPVGTAEDPFACDATRARLAGAELGDTRISVFCTTADTRIHIMGAATRFDETMARLIAWLDTDPIEIDAGAWADYVAAGQAMQRDPSFLRLMSAETWALLGEGAMDARRPSVAELRERGATALPAAIETLRQLDPDVLYVGPDPERLRAALPPARGRTMAGPPLRAYRSQTPGTVDIVVMDDPRRDDVAVRAALPWIAQTPTEQLAAWIHDSVASNAETAADWARDDEHLGYDVPWSPGTPLAIGVGFRVAPDAVLDAIDTAVAAVRRRPSAEAFTHARTLLEAGFRAQRPGVQHIPAIVYTWPADGSDPRVAQWLALPSLSHEDVVAYHDRVDAVAPAVVVVGDLRAIDLDALGRRGRVVRIEAEAIMKDAAQAYRHDTSGLLNE